MVLSDQLVLFPLRSLSKGATGRPLELVDKVKAHFNTESFRRDFPNASDTFDYGDLPQQLTKRTIYKCASTELYATSFISIIKE